MATEARSNAWYQRPELVAHWLADFIIGQMRQLRPNYAPPAQFSGLTLSRDDADIDSIELIDVASALYLALDAEASGSIDAAPIGRSFASWCAFVTHAAARTKILSFYTSGSTGKPRRIEHRMRDLDAEMSDFLPQLRAGGFIPERIVTVMPCQHLYGFLFGILLPAQLNLPMFACKGQAAAQVRAQLQPGDVLIAHPHFWTGALVSDAPYQANRPVWPVSMLGLSSGQALSDEVFERAQSQHIRMLEIYGATETAGIAWRDTPGPMRLMSRYELSDGGQLLDRYQQNLLVAAPDQLEATEDGRLHVRARHDRVVQVAGVNVHLEHVEQTIRAVSGVAKLYVDLDVSTQRLHAWLVSQPLDETALRRSLQTHLTSAEMPARWFFVTALPKVSNWKAL